MRPAILTLAVCIAARGEIVDRVAVTVENSVIAASEIAIQVRVAALIDGQPLKLDEATLRTAADRLIEQAIVRREIALADYPVPSKEAVDKAIEDWKIERLQGSPVRYREALAQYGVTEEELRDQIRWQLTVLRFVELRFRPAVQVPNEDIRDYYREKFVSDWTKNATTPPPPLPQVRDRIETVLMQEAIEHALDRWLNLTRTQLAISFRNDAFKEIARP